MNQDTNPTKGNQTIPSSPKEIIAIKMIRSKGVLRIPRSNRYGKLKRIAPCKALCFDMGSACEPKIPCSQMVAMHTPAIKVMYLRSPFPTSSSGNSAPASPILSKSLLHSVLVLPHTTTTRDQAASDGPPANLHRP